MTQRMIDIHKPVTICKASAGTGKTYTLAAYYVGLLLSGEDYRSILAITFTNKATAEMSERILGYLYAISQGGEKKFLEKARQFMIRDLEASDEMLQQRAAKYFKMMLLDFDNVQIRTIDSFQQMLLKGLASLLRQSAGLNTELDSDHVISEAVEQLLTTEMTEQDLAIMRDYLNVRLEQEETVYIKKSLCALAQEMYNESVQMLEADKKIVFDAQLIAERRKRIAAQRDKAPEIIALREELEHLWSELSAVDTKGCDGNAMKSIKAALKNVHASLNTPDEIKKKDLFRGLTDDAYGKISAGEGVWAAFPSHISRMAIEMTDKAHECRAYYATVDLSIALSHEMQLMTSLQRIIQRNLNEANCALMSRTASILDSALKDGDADFILEKAGIRYHHVLMDEFQDTSKLQWSVIEKLLRDIVAGEGNTLLIVGDIKQSIYRWRNGDWHIMDALTDEQQAHPLTTERRNPHLQSLTKNFRSSEQVVNFNLSLFKHIIDQADDELIRRIYDEGFDPEHLAQFYQSDVKQGGYVRFQALESKEDCLKQLFDTMEQLLPRIAPSDMMVLVRGKEDAKLITQSHAMLDATEYPNLSQASFVSASSFQLDASDAVNTVIAALRLVENKKDDIAAHQIELNVQKPGVIEQIHARVKRLTPLYEAVCELVKILLTDEHGQYVGQETAYINNLLDRTRAYVQSYGSNRTDFLQYWDETMHEKPIPSASTGAIQIMTIHKSKGLQRQTLFIPFCNWAKDEGKASAKIWCPIAPMLKEGKDYIPVQAASEMAESDYSPYYENEHSDLRVDSINMLYVALTRAEDNLFVFTNYALTQAGEAPKHVGSYIVDFIGKEYEVGEIKIKDKGQGTKDKGKEKKDEPFSFSEAPVSTAELWANSDQVRFVQSQEGAMYTELGDEAYRRVARMDEGTLCHAIFAALHTKDELDQVLDQFESNGDIKSAEQREKLKSLISTAWEGNEQMRSWFVDPWELKLEQGIMDGKKEIRPDRVMIDRTTNDAIVLDYKFGHWESEYKMQVQKYMDALRQMGHPHVKGYLWFAQENKLIEVKGEKA